MTKSFLLVTLAIVVLLNSACTTRQIIRNSEYDRSTAAFRSGDVPQALEHFPAKEKDGFVTSVEKSWLGFWDGETDNAVLLKQAKTLDDRNYISVSREAEYFFYNESADGYIPAEHEIIVMHLVNSMYFMRNKKWESAAVEARRAAFFMQNYFKEDQSHFDDPALRIWLAGIWAALGEWNEAQVDLRKAYDLSRDKSLLPLLKSNHPPSNFHVVFTGSGPQVIWHEGEMSPTFTETSTPPLYSIKFNTLPWFLRHETRNTEIRNVVMKSNYMAQYYGLNTSVGAEKSLGFVVANGLRAAGIAVAIVIIGGVTFLVLAIASQGGAGNMDGAGEVLGAAFTGGFVVGEAIFKEGDKVQSNVDVSSAKSKKEGLEKLKTYRYVRFLPTWISVSDKLEFPGTTGKSFEFKAPSSKTTVNFQQDF